MAESSSSRARLSLDSTYFERMLQAGGGVMSCSHVNDYVQVDNVWCSQCEDTVETDVDVCVGSGFSSWKCPVCKTEDSAKK